MTPKPLDPDVAPRKGGHRSHGLSETPIYQAWLGVRSVTRGGGAVPEWSDPARFIADIGDQSHDHHLERPDPSRPWGPGNCQWVLGAPGRGKAVRHGMSDTPSHQAWTAARRQGGRVPAWDSFETFLAGMGERPAGHVLGRLDRSAPHGPGNSVWRPSVRSQVRAVVDDLERRVAEAADDVVRVAKYG